jgi:hypothetical protein
LHGQEEWAPLTTTFVTIVEERRSISAEHLAGEVFDLLEEC